MLVAVLAAVVTFAAPQAQGDGAPKQEPNTVAGVEVKKTPDKDKVVCRREAEIGTRMTKKVCTRMADAEDRKVQDRDNLDHIQALTPAPQTR